jgi:hypothetical protein
MLLLVGDIWSAKSGAGSGRPQFSRVMNRMDL